jgi:hypothetical protein
LSERLQRLLLLGDRCANLVPHDAAHGFGEERTPLGGPKGGENIGG